METEGATPSALIEMERDVMLFGREREEIEEEEEEEAHEGGRRDQ